MHLFLDMTCIIMLSLKISYFLFKAKSNKKSKSNSDFSFLKHLVFIKKRLFPKKLVNHFLLYSIKSRSEKINAVRGMCNLTGRTSRAPD